MTPPEIDRTLSAYFRRDVRLARSAPDDFTIDQYHPNIEGADPAGHRNTVVEQKLGSAFFTALGIPSPVAVGAFFDLFAKKFSLARTIDWRIRPTKFGGARANSGWVFGTISATGLCTTQLECRFARSWVRSGELQRYTSRGSN